MNEKQIEAEIEKGPQDLIINFDQDQVQTLPAEDSPIIYNPNLLDTIQNAQTDTSNERDLDLSRTDVEMDIKDMYLLDKQDFTLARREGLGGSDSSVVLGVNPYTTLDELIKQKASPTLSAEELETSKQVAVRKGNDLEPLIIQKATKVLNVEILKPPSQYKFKKVPYLKMNFDGVINDPKQYRPCEIKVCTARGERHYNVSKCLYYEPIGWRPPIKNFAADQHLSIQQKASYYGIPPYYYTQVQQEMLAVGADYAYLAVLFEKSWMLGIFLIHQDVKTQIELLRKAEVVWRQVLDLRMKNLGSESIWTGPLAEYAVWQGPEHLGKPIPLMVEHVKRLIATGTRIKIFTARVSSKNTPKDIELATKTIQAWCKEHLGKELEVTAEKDHYMLEYYDDRAITVQFNTGRILNEELL